MARWPFLVALLLLSGCTTPPSTPPSEDTLDAGRTSIAGGQDGSDGFVNTTLEFTGQLKGVGLVMPDGSAHFVGVSTFSDEFATGPGAALDVTLTWDLTAPALVDLILYTPEGKAVVQDGGVPDSQIGRTIHHSAVDVPEGRWSVMARSQGPAVVDYRIVVVIAYP